MISNYYIDGQKIAKRLSKNITKETRNATRLVNNYNKQCYSTEQSTISLTDVLSPDSPFWVTETSACSDGISLKVRRDIIEAFLHIQRSNEELELLITEMESTVQYWSSRIKTLTDKLQEIDMIDGDKQIYDVGAACLLNKVLYEARISLSEAVEGFSKIFEVNNEIIKTNIFQTESSINNDSDISSSSESDSDNDDRDINYVHYLVS